MLLFFFGLVLCLIGGITATASKCLSECQYSADKWAFNTIGFHCYTTYRAHRRCIPRPRNLNVKEGNNVVDHYVSPVYKYRMNSGDVCHGRCVKDGKSYLWCMNPALSNWDYCAENDIIEYKAWQVIRNKINSFAQSQPSQLDYCNNFIDQYENNKHPTSLDEVLASIRSAHDYVYHMTNELDKNGPIKNVEMIFVPGYEDEKAEIDRAEINLTLAITAKIEPIHALNYQCDIITSAIIDRCNELNKNSDDEIGYFLSNAFGGRPTSWNLAPLSKITELDSNDINCGNGITIWNRIDNSILKFLSSKSAGYVEWNLVVNYGFLPTSLRPTDFLLQVVLKDKNGNTVSYPDEVFNRKEKLEIRIKNKSPSQTS